MHFFRHRPPSIPTKAHQRRINNNAVPRIQSLPFVTFYLRDRFRLSLLTTCPFHSPLINAHLMWQQTHSDSRTCWYMPRQCCQQPLHTCCALRGPPCCTRESCPTRRRLRSPHCHWQCRHCTRHVRSAPPWRASMSMASRTLPSYPPFCTRGPPCSQRRRPRRPRRRDPNAQSSAFGHCSRTRRRSMTRLSWSRPTILRAPKVRRLHCTNACRLQAQFQYSVLRCSNALFLMCAGRLRLDATWSDFLRRLGSSAGGRVSMLHVGSRARCNFDADELGYQFSGIIFCGVIRINLSDLAVRASLWSRAQSATPGRHPSGRLLPAAFVSTSHVVIRGGRIAVARTV